MSVKPSMISRSLLRRERLLMVEEASCMVLLLIDVYTREILSINVHEGREGIDSFWVAGKIAQVMTKTKRKSKRLIHDRDPLFKGQVKWSAEKCIQ